MPGSLIDSFLLIHKRSCKPAALLHSVNAKGLAVCLTLTASLTNYKLINCLRHQNQYVPKPEYLKIHALKITFVLQGCRSGVPLPACVTCLCRYWQLVLCKRSALDSWGLGSTRFIHSKDSGCFSPTVIESSLLGTLALFQHILVVARTIYSLLQTAMCNLCFPYVGREAAGSTGSRGHGRFLGSSSIVYTRLECEAQKLKMLETCRRV